MDIRNPLVHIELSFNDCSYQSKHSVLVLLCNITLPLLSPIMHGIVHLNEILSLVCYGILNGYGYGCEHLTLDDMVLLKKRRTSVNDLELMLPKPLLSSLNLLGAVASSPITQKVHLLPSICMASSIEAVHSSFGYVCTSIPLILTRVSRFIEVN